MRIINKKYLLIILLIGIILTGGIIFKPKENVKLDSVILKQEVNNRTFAMYTETDNGYEEYKGNKFPSGYRLNEDKSKCIDNNEEEIENAIYTENNQIGVKSNKSFYCYLYFDEKENLSNICNESTMEECMKDQEKLDKIKTIENLSDEIKGGMFRYQGQAVDVDNNYICFGTSDKDECVSDTDHYMYRIIGIEKTGRIKLIKKEALNETYQWYTDSDHDITFPKSKIYEAINDVGFLKNNDYVPKDWEEKIENNTWMYGDMHSDDTLGAKQTGEELYKTETGQKETWWYNLADEQTENAFQITVGYNDPEYYGKTVYYTNRNGNWKDNFTGKVSLMYLHDYYYSVSDEANCLYNAQNYEICQTGWMHLSNNDKSAPYESEWTMSRWGFYPWRGFYNAYYIAMNGSGGWWGLSGNLSVRPVFYIVASGTLISGLGTIESPFIINN